VQRLVAGANAFVPPCGSACRTVSGSAEASLAPGRDSGFAPTVPSEIAPAAGPGPSSGAACATGSTTSTTCPSALTSVFGGLKMCFVCSSCFIISGGIGSGFE